MTPTLIVSALALIVAIASIIITRRNPQLEVLPYTGNPPTRAHKGDAGLDLTANENIVIPSMGWRLVPTGTKTAIPEGYAGLVCPRSGLAAKHGITVLNAPGIIDAGYRGDIGVVLINHGAKPFEVQAGDRIAQLLIMPYTNLTPVGLPLDNTDRGDNGFGSTGKD
ncbi:dUTP diphosphatase [Corynebacterium amycolatum]|uniref:dUTP diphosphatase n=1 Tax=Corynebacterium amycolatum TaxID=43765 RepID=UPI002AADC475|nr:dUTP diphosphatase [Corynebacterium amycolatum]MDY7341384.1 dUTP diphosphatase [Corynebacterium amycolatum]